MNKGELQTFLKQESTQLFELADQIWDYAETAFEEYQSARALCGALRHYGFSVEENVADISTAFCGTYGSGSPVIAFLAEYDALSGLSQKAGSSVKEPVQPGGSGHGCGHNLLGVGSLAAAVALKEYMERNHLRGTVKLFGCPGEEGGSGKAFMAREGVFQGVDVAFCWHPMEVNAILDHRMLANYQVLYRFKGVAAHAAAAPHCGRSALDAVELMNVGANFLREHIIPEARIHYAITNAGGYSPNVVQSEGEVLYLIRAPKSQQVEEIYQRVNKIAQGAALMTETALDIQFVKSCSNVVPNKTLSKVLYENFQAVPAPEYTPEELAFAKEISATCPHSAVDLSTYSALPEEELERCQQQLAGKALCDMVIPFSERGDVLISGSSDVGDVSWNVPTAQVATACYCIGTPGHSWQLVSQDRTSIGHKGMLYAANVLACGAVDVLEHPEYINQAAAELKKRLGGVTYRCAIPHEVKPTPISQL